MNTYNTAKEGPPPIGILFDELEKRAAAIRQELATLEQSLQPCLRVETPTESKPMGLAPAGTQLRSMVEKLSHDLEDLHAKVRSLCTRVDL